MATPKPAAISTNFFRSVRSCRPQTYRSIRSPPSTNVSRRIHGTSRTAQEQRYERYGPAAAPSMPPPAKPTEPFLPSTAQTQADATDAEEKRTERHHREQLENQKRKDEAEDGKDAETSNAASEPQPEETQTAQAEPTEATPTQTGSPSEASTIPAIDDGPLPNRELDVVLSVPSPNEVRGTISSHPHLEASPYEHHFDTYTLVQELCKPIPNDNPAFTEAQSVTLMKAIRLMLAQNLDLAKDGLVSKSDTENETYLFRAACSELKTTMQTSRFMEAQKQRSQRAQLQHESDILNQKVSQDIMTMREELKGMFNDRKLGLQEEKRQVDGKIQGLTYRISVDLNSEAKSEVEGLRWVLTRRAAMAIGAAAAMVLTFLQLHSIRSKESAEIEKRKKAERKKQEERLEREQERFGVSGAAIGRSTGTQTDGIVLGGTAGGGNYEESMG